MGNPTDYQEALLKEVRELPEEALPNLLQIVRLFKESLLQEERQAARFLQKELLEWDHLSDEALTEFEKGLS